jgi:hypothetical protein
VKKDKKGRKKNIAANMLAAKEKERNYIILQKNKECFMESVEKKYMVGYIHHLYQRVGRVIENRTT